MSDVPEESGGAEKAQKEEREANAAGGEAARNAGGKDATEAEKEAAQKAALELRKNILDIQIKNFSEGGKGLKSSLDTAKAFKNMSSKERANLESGLKKVFGSDPPFGFDESGNPIEDLTPKNFKPGDDPANIFTDLDKKISAINDELGKRKVSLDERSALLKYYKNIAEFNDSSFQTIDTPKNIRDILSKDPKDLTPNDKNIRNDYLKKVQAWAKSDKAQQKLRDIADKKAASGKSEPTLTDSTIRVLLKLLMFAGSLAAALYFLQSYANCHSGCMVIYKIGVDDIETQEKIFCGKDSNNPISFAPQQCYCNSPDDFKTGSPIGVDCNSSSDEPRPAEKFKSDAQKICIGDISSLKVPYRYYAYQVMSAGDAGLNIISRGGDAAGRGLSAFFKILINAAIWIGAVIGILLVLYIIYKIVSKKTNSYGKYKGLNTPVSVKSMFGLNYAKMGRCKPVRSLKR